METGAIFLFIASNVVTLLASHIVIALMQDMYHVVPLSIARRLKIADKRLSNSTLPHQSWALLFSTVFFTVALGVQTALVFKHSAMLIVRSGGMAVPVSAALQAELDGMGFKAAYRDTPYSWSSILALT